MTAGLLETVRVVYSFLLLCVSCESHTIFSSHPTTSGLLAIVLWIFFWLYVDCKKLVISKIILNISLFAVTLDIYKEKIFELF